jgi:hypothetical protein
MIAELEQHKKELMLKDIARSTPSIPNLWKIFGTSIQETPTSKAVETLRRAIIEQSRPTLDGLKRATYEDKFREAPELVKSAEIWLSRMDALDVIEKALTDPFPAEMVQSEVRKPERASDVQAIPSALDPAKSAITEAATPQSTSSTESISTIHDSHLDAFGSAPQQTAPEDKHQQPNSEDPFQGDWCGTNRRVKSGGPKELSGKELWLAPHSERDKANWKLLTDFYRIKQSILSPPDHEDLDPTIAEAPTPAIIIPTISISPNNELFLHIPNGSDLPAGKPLSRQYSESSLDISRKCNNKDYPTPWENFVLNRKRLAGGGLEELNDHDLRVLVRSQFCSDEDPHYPCEAQQLLVRLSRDTMPFDLPAKKTIYVPDIGNVSLFHGVEADRILAQKGLVVRMFSALGFCFFPRCGSKGNLWERTIKEILLAKRFYWITARHLLERLSSDGKVPDRPEQQIIYVSEIGEIFLYDVFVGGKKETGQSLVQGLASEIVYLWSACDLKEYPWEMIIEELPRVEGGGLDGLRDEELREIVRSQWCV